MIERDPKKPDPDDEKDDELPSDKDDPILKHSQLPLL